MQGSGERIYIFKFLLLFKIEKEKENNLIFLKIKITQKSNDYHTLIVVHTTFAPLKLYFENMISIKIVKSCLKVYNNN